LAQAQYGKGSQKAQEWVEAALTRLFSNRIDGVIVGIKRMRPDAEKNILTKPETGANKKS